MDMVVAFFFLALLATWVYSDARARHDPQPGLWAIGTFLLAIVVLPLWLIKRASKSEATAGSLRPCPYCAEQVQAAAVVCRFCQKTIEAVAMPVTTAHRTNMVRVLALGLAGGIGLLVVVVLFVTFGSDAAVSTVSRGVSGQSGVTMAKYLQLHEGMSYRDAVATLGSPGIEQSRSELGGITTVMYTWSGSGSLGANMNAMFQNDRLITKAQFGLR